MQCIIGLLLFWVLFVYNYVLTFAAFATNVGSLDGGE